METLKTEYFENITVGDLQVLNKAIGLEVELNDGAITGCNITGTDQLEG